MITAGDLSVSSQLLVIDLVYKHEAHGFYNPEHNIETLESGLHLYTDVLAISLPKRPFAEPVLVET